MLRNGPVTRNLIRAVPGSAPGLRDCWILMLGASILCASAWAAPATKPAAEVKAATGPATAQTRDTAPGTCRRGSLRSCRRRGQGVRFQSSQQAGPRARQERCYMRDLPRRGQSARGSRRRRFEDIQSCQGNSRRCGRNLPGLPRRRASQLRAFSSCQGGVGCTAATAFIAARTRSNC